MHITEAWKLIAPPSLQAQKLDTANDFDTLPAASTEYVISADSVSKDQQANCKRTKSRNV
jgi:hypothetical protein